MYWNILRTGWRQQRRYWWNLLFSFAGDFLKTYIKICIWTALMAEDGQEAVAGMAVYSMIGTVVTLLTDTRVAQELAERFRSGQAALDLIRPVSLKGYFFCYQLGENLFRFLTEGLLLLLAFWLAWRVECPGAETVAGFCVCTGLAMVLLFLIQYTMGLLVFWMKDGTYTRMLTDAMFTLFSGLVIPLWLYPDGLAAVCEYLPFRYVVAEPAAVFLQGYGWERWIRVAAAQLLWIGTVWMIERLVWTRIRRGIEIQGG